MRDIPPDARYFPVYQTTRVPVNFFFIAAKKQIKYLERNTNVVITLCSKILDGEGGGVGEKSSLRVDKIYRPARETNEGRFFFFFFLPLPDGKRVTLSRAASYPLSRRGE